MMDKLSRYEQVWMNAYVMCERSYDVAAWADRVLEEFRARFDAEEVEAAPSLSRAAVTCVGQDGEVRLHGVLTTSSPFAVLPVCVNCGATVKK